MFFIFGTGKVFNSIKQCFDFERCLGLIDNDVKKQGMTFCGKSVFPPVHLTEVMFDAVYICSRQTVEIFNQLVELGIPKAKIHNYTEICIPPIKKASVTFYNPSFRTTEKQRLLFIVNGFPLCGAITALLQVCRMLRKQFQISVLTDTDGTARPLYEKLDVEIILDSRMRVISLNELGYEQRYDIFFFNALQLASVISRFTTRKKVFWWLHEPEEYYNLDIFYDSYIQRINLPNLKVFGVGELACSPFRKRTDQIKIEPLLYALPEIDGYGHSRYFKVACIGLISQVKGQDLLLDAFEMMDVPDDVKLHLIGDNSGVFGKQITDRAERMKNVIVRGELSQDEIAHEYKDIDLLICPSRMDCMPVVIAQAMQNGVPVILSDACGTVSYIHDMKDGIIFHTASIKDLISKLSWAFNHRESLKEIGKKGYLIYKAYFTGDLLKKNIMEAFND